MLDIERTGPVWVVRMRNGENRFNDRTIAELNQALDKVETGERPAALVTTGEGKFYSNGLDLDWMASQGEHRAAAFLGEVHRLLGRVLGLSVATVSAINGHAFAAGAMLACAHDFRIMRKDRGYWCLPEIDIGFPVTGPMYAVLAAKLPPAALHESLVTGRRYAADPAAAAGIVSEAVAEDQVERRAIEIASELATKDPRVMAEHKRLMFASALDICSNAAPPESTKEA